MRINTHIRVCAGGVWLKLYPVRFASQLKPEIQYPLSISVLFTPLSFLFSALVRTTMYIISSFTVAGGHIRWGRSGCTSEGTKTLLM